MKTINCCVPLTEKEIYDLKKATGMKTTKEALMSAVDSSILMYRLAVGEKVEPPIRSLKE